MDDELPPQKIIRFDTSRVVSTVKLIEQSHREMLTSLCREWIASTFEKRFVIHTSICSKTTVTGILVYECQGSSSYSVYRTFAQ
jgi:hypothetical protein